MSEAPQNVSSRRDFLKNSSKLAAGASVLAGTSIPHVYAADDSTIKIALVGCGGRGTGAAANALSTTSGPIKLVAMADVFEHRLNTSYKSLEKQFGDK
ncbi:MAG TPA: streptomycin biosynthesis protein StrI, partial [Planctomycetaceae bacterium]|nr:streptomycin biosynthesis protein StrI [Planctomycetaceae bacterium]